jgi:hypothetical protein
LRSIQRIENGEVLPRVYTLRLLEECLGVALVGEPGVGNEVELDAAGERARSEGLAPEGLGSEGSGAEGETGAAASSSGAVGRRVEMAKSVGWSRPRKWILSVSVGLLMLLLTGAFLAQSARFPETDFERLLLWSGVLAVYAVILLRVWK